jgi:hypothetical protein
LSVLSLPAPATATPAAASASAFAPGSRKLAVPGRPVDRATLAHHLAVLPLPARTLALVTGNAPGELPADAVLVRWVAVRLRALSARLTAGETSGSAFRQEATGLASLGPDPAPAGEEMLVGLAAAARRLATWRLVPVPAVAAFQASLVGLSGTGVPPSTSRALDDAVRGGFPAHVVSLVELLGDSEAEDGALKEATFRLTGNGTRPGADILAGIVAIVRDVALGPL